MRSVGKELQGPLRGDGQRSPWENVAAVDFGSGRSQRRGRRRQRLQPRSGTGDQRAADGPNIPTYSRDTRGRFAAAKQGDDADKAAAVPLPLAGVRAEGAPPPPAYRHFQDLLLPPLGPGATALARVPPPRPPTYAASPPASSRPHPPQAARADHGGGRGCTAAGARARGSGALNTIVMNAVLEACVRCGDVDRALRIFEDMRGPRGCGVDGVSYGILLKGARFLIFICAQDQEGLGIARRIDQAFEVLESIEKDTTIGSPRLSPHLICGFLNALIEAGDMRRANALVARFRKVLYEGHSVLLYNLLMKGYIRSNFPLGALTVKDEILRQGLKPDRLTYNTIISACVKSAEIDRAIQFLEDMKVSHKCWKGQKKLIGIIILLSSLMLLPTTLLKGLGNSRDLYSVLKIVVEMKSSLLSIDRTAYTAMIDALLACECIDGALCIFGEIMKQAGDNRDLRPKPHLYLSIMRTFASRGDVDMVAVKVESLSGFTNSLSKTPFQKYMVPFQESRPLPADLILRKVVMRFLEDCAVPLVDDWGGCVGIVHRDDCTKLDAPLLSMVRGPPLCVPTSTSVEHVIDLLLREKTEMVIVVKNGNMYEGSYTSSSRPLGVFSLAILWKFTDDSSSDIHNAAASQVTLKQEDSEACSCG
ncbi:hypothetical protein PR202_ga15820 [Eleusine coracana subsp. coracana]|uniref:CBS domain-containing protein n=1 Tax=Eleusine coracana subsp. coracana TaxID=191504 RepID=A0AAV5CK20_ELECO|nr:hypothetical protein PR202_ga15820 [Eleusine coracana subsp. coracana]